MKKVLLLFGVLGMISCSPDPDSTPPGETAVSETETEAEAKAKAEAKAEAEATETEAEVLTKAKVEAEAEAEARVANSYYTISNDSKIVVKVGIVTIAAGECKKFKGSLFPLTITKVDGSDYTLLKKQYKAGNYSLRQKIVSALGPGPRNITIEYYATEELNLLGSDDRDCS